MFNLDTDDRLTAWSNVRKQVETDPDPLQVVVDFWNETPFTPLNHLVDPYYQAGWPTPWEIIVHNKYDDFTKAIMIGYTILSTDRFKNSKVQIKTLVDNDQNRLYNVVCVDDVWALNLRDSEAVSIDNIPSLYRLENLVELSRPR